MEELKVLGPTVLKRKKHGIPVGVRYWLFFKRHVLEKPEVRPLFEKEVTREEFALLVKKHANPLKHGPSFCRRKRSQASNKRNTNDMLAVLYRYHQALLSPDSPIEVRESSEEKGLGIYLRQGAGAKQGQTLLEGQLFGTLFEVNDKEEIEELRAEGYPSLLEPFGTKNAEKNKVFAVCGPLSLANHSCTAGLRFTLPRSMMPRERDREFHGLQAVYAQAIKENGYRGRAGQEVTVHYDAPSSSSSSKDRPTYFSGGTKRCRCSKCQPTSKKMKERKDSSPDTEH